MPQHRVRVFSDGLDGCNFLRDSASYRFQARRCTSFSCKNIGFITELCVPNSGHWHFGCQSYSAYSFVVLH